MCLLRSVAAEKASVCECKQNKSQTEQNSHLAVEPAAPAVLCRKKCADYFKYGVVFLHSLRYFLFFLHYSGALVNNSTSTTNKEGVLVCGPMCRWKVQQYMAASKMSRFLEIKVFLD